jgi:hypothetical protein
LILSFISFRRKAFVSAGSPPLIFFFAKKKQLSQVLSTNFFKFGQLGSDSEGLLTWAQDEHSIHIQNWTSFWSTGDAIVAFASRISQRPLPATPEARESEALSICHDLGITVFGAPGTIISGRCPIIVQLQVQAIRDYLTIKETAREDAAFHNS